MKHEELTEKIIEDYEIQHVNYLVATSKDVGLLLNFGEQKVDVNRKVRHFKRMYQIPGIFYHVYPFILSTKKSR